MNIIDDNDNILCAALAFSYQIARRLGPIDTGDGWAMQTRDTLVEHFGRKRGDVALRVADELVESITLPPGKKAIIKKLYRESGVAHAESFHHSGEAVTAADNSGGFIAADAEVSGPETAKLITELLQVASKL
jgi:hypothetical protein